MSANRAAVSAGVAFEGEADAEARLVELARSAEPLRRVVAALAGPLVERRGWERLGYARLADYARERLGLSARSVQDFARVDRALAELPRLESALVSGRLPWSKVRLLVRCASSRDEEQWIAVAERTGVRELERACRAVDRGALEGRAAAEVEEEAAEAAEWVRLRGPIALAFQWKRAVEATGKVSGQRLSPGAALENVTAEVASALPPEPEGDGLPLPAIAPSAHSGEDVATSPPSLPADGDGPGPGTAADAELPVFLRPLLAGIDRADAFELDARLRRAIRLEQRLDAQMAPLLRHVTSSEFEWRERFHTLAAYARERLGVSPRKARALVRLERVGDVCPELRASYRDGSLSWVQAQILSPVLARDVEGDWRRAWVLWAQRVTVRRLQAVVDHAIWLRESGSRVWDRDRGDPEHIAALLSGGAPEEPDDQRQTCARPRDPLGSVQIRVWASAEAARLFRAVLCRVRLAIERESGRLPSEAEGFEAMIDHAMTSWGVDDPRLRRRRRQKYAVFERDDWRCTVPGCSSRRNLHAHHVVFRSAGGSDALENQTTLCAHHHQRGVHGGTVRITGFAPDALWFELGTREGRPPLARYRSGDRVA